MDRWVTLRHPGPKQTLTLSLAVALAFSLGACFPDYDRFRGVTPADAGAENNNTSDDADSGGEQDVEDDVDMGGDADADMPMDADTGEPDADAGDDADDGDADPVDADADDDADADEGDADADDDVSDADVEDEDMPTAGIGAACNSDDDCEGGLVCQTDFDNGLCTLPCEDDSVCPADAVCGAEVGVPYCLLTCENSCAAVRPFECSDFRGGPRVCVSDDDLDGVLNQVDNCPEGVFNPNQYDADNDGVGDLCDDDAYCPEGAPEELLERGFVVEHPSPPRPLTGGGLAYLRPLDRFLYLGGYGADGEPTRSVMTFNRALSTWETGAIPQLPYAATGVKAAYDTYRQELVATPGDGPASRLLYLSVEGVYQHRVGQWRLGPRLGTPVYGAEIAYLFPHYVAVWGYTSDDPEALDNSLIAYLLDRRDGSLTQLAFVQPVSPDQVKSLTLMPSTDLGAFYGIAAGLLDRVFEIDPEAGTYNFLRDPEAPDSPGLNFSPFNLSQPPLPASAPILAVHVHAPYVYLARADTGEFQRIVFEDDGQGTISSAFRLDVPDGQVFEEIEFQGAFDPVTHAAFMLKTSGDPATTVVTEHFPLCQRELSGNTLIDIDIGDGGGQSSLRDNCPTERNTDQADTDRDGVGDVCDDDIDGDGVPNAEDLIVVDASEVDLSNDTDNDGLDNDVDPDADGDRIPDDADDHLADTDNDGIPNHFDEDDDADGFADSVERDGGSSSADWVSVPGGDRIVALLDDGNRTLVLSTLSGMADLALLGEGDVDTVTTGDAVVLAPTLIDGAPWLVYTNAADVANPSVVLQGLTLTQEMMWPPPITSTPDGLLSEEAVLADANPAPQVAVLRMVPNPSDPDNEPPVYSLDLLVPDVDMNLLAETRNLFTSPFPLFALKDQPGGELTFTESIEGCDICGDAYFLAYSDAEADAPIRIPNSDTGGTEVDVTLSPSGDFFLLLAGPQDGRAVYVGDPDDIGGPVRVSPEGYQVRHATYGQTDDRVVLSARPEGSQGPFTLWVIDLTTGRMVELSAEGVDVLDFDVAR